MSFELRLNKLNDGVLMLNVWGDSLSEKTCVRPYLIAKISSGDQKDSRAYWDRVAGRTPEGKGKPKNPYASSADKHSLLLPAEDGYAAGIPIAYANLNRYVFPRDMFIYYINEHGVIFETCSSVFERPFWLESWWVDQKPLFRFTAQSVETESTDDPDGVYKIDSHWFMSIAESASVGFDIILLCGNEIKGRKVGHHVNVQGNMTGNFYYISLLENTSFDMMLAGDGNEVGLVRGN